MGGPDIKIKLTLKEVLLKLESALLTLFTMDLFGTAQRLWGGQKSPFLRFLIHFL